MKGIFIFIFSIVLSSWISAQNDSIHDDLIGNFSFDQILNLKVVTAEKHSQKIEEVTASVDVLNKEDIERYGYKSLNELIQNITGFYFIDDCYWLGSENFGVRGYFKNGPFSNVAILVNGISQQSDKYADYPSSKITIPIEAIDRIEIIRGPMAIIYGNGAFFGVINIITKADNENPTLKSFVLASAGNYNSYRTSFKLTEKIKDYSVNLVAGANQENGVNMALGDITSDTTLLSYAGLTTNSSTKDQLNKSNFYTGFNVGFKDFTFDMSYNGSSKGTYDGLPSYREGNRIQTTAVNSAIRYFKEFSPEFEFSGSFGYFYHSHMLSYETFRKYYYEIDYQRTNSIEFRFDIQWKPSEKFKLLSGFDRRTVLSCSQISDFDYYGLNSGDGETGLPKGETFSTNAIYSQLTFSPFNKVTLVGGLRVEYLEPYNMYYARGVVSEDTSDQRPIEDPANRLIIEKRYKPENKGITVIPRLALMIEPFPKYFIKLLYGEAQKQPSFSENYRQLPKNRPQLKASRIRTFELNYFSYATKNAIINASIFYNQLNNIINLTNVYNYISGEWEIYSTNSGMFNTKGLEIQVKQKIGSSFSYELSGIFQHTKNEVAGYENIEVAYSPNFTAYGKFLYKINTNLTFAVLARYIGEMETDWITESTPEKGKRLGNKTNDYALFDLNIRKENLFQKNIFCDVKLNNTLNSEYRFPVTKSNNWIDKGLLGPKRSLLVTLGYKF